MTATSQRGMVRVFLWLVVAAHTAIAIPAGAAPETPCVEPTSFWTHDDVLLLDGWGDTGSAATDLIAGYAKLAGQDLVLRFDYLDLHEWRARLHPEPRGAPQTVIKLPRTDRPPRPVIGSTDRAAGEPPAETNPISTSRAPWMRPLWMGYRNSV